MSQQQRVPSHTEPMTMPAGSTASGSVAYVSNADSKEVCVFQVGTESNLLNLIQKVGIPGIDGPSPFSSPLAVSPDRRFLYAVLRKPPFPVSTYKINSIDGTLKLAATACLHDSVCYLSIDRTGRFMLSASYFGGNIAINQIDTDGGVQSKARQIIQTGPKTHSIIVDGANRYAYGASIDNEAIFQFRFDENKGKFESDMPGSLRLPAGSGPRHLVFGPSGRFLYVINEYSATIAVLSVNAQSGALSAKQTVNLLPPGTFRGVAEAADIHMTPDGRFLFGSERISSTITSFSVEAGSGMLTRVESVGTEKEPRCFAMHPQGRHLLVAGQSSKSLSFYRVAPDSGQMHLVAREQLDGNPSWIEIVDLSEGKKQ